MANHTGIGLSWRGAPPSSLVVAYGKCMDEEMKKWQEHVLARLESLENTVGRLVEGEERSAAVWKEIERQEQRARRV